MHRHGVFLKGDINWAGRVGKKKSSARKKVHARGFELWKGVTAERG